MEIDLHRMPEMLGDIPVVPVSARKRTGLEVLLHAVVHHYQEVPSEHIVHYTADIEKKNKEADPYPGERIRRGPQHPPLACH